MILQNLELSVVKQVLDVYLQLACAVRKSNVKHILQAICTRLNNVSIHLFTRLMLLEKVFIFV